MEPHAISGADRPSEPKSVLSKAGPFLKVLFGAGIFAWMAASGKLNFAEIVKAFRTGRSCSRFSGWAIRSRSWSGDGGCFLRTQDVPLPFRQTWGLTMIGMLFNVAIPGAVGGDLIKGYYITRVAPGRKAQAATSIVMDRVAGLIGLFFLGAVGVLVNPAETLRNPATRSLGAFTVAGALGGFAGLSAALLTGGRLSQWSFLPGAARICFFPRYTSTAGNLRWS